MSLSDLRYFLNPTAIEFDGEKLPKELQPLPTDGDFYVLSIWRGEWSEFYTSWNKKNSLTFDENNYFLFKSRKAVGMLSMLGLFVAITGVYLFFGKSFYRRLNG